jgi:hypothetical protein
MKNKYLLVSALLLTLFVSAGCSDNDDDSSSSTDSNITTDTNTTQCEANETLENGVCVATDTDPSQKCTNGQTWNEESQTCETVDPSQECTNGQAWNEESQTCETVDPSQECTNGQTWNEESQTCEIVDPSQECTNGQTWNEESQTCETSGNTNPDECEANQTLVDGVCVDNGESSINPECSTGQFWDTTNEVCVDDCPTGQHWDPLEKTCGTCQTGAVWNEESFTCICNAEEGLIAMKNGQCDTFKNKCTELERFWNESIATDHTVNACEVWRDCETEMPNSTRTDSNNTCECDKNFILSDSEDGMFCKIDMDAFPVKVTGQVFDGSIANVNSAISLCSIVDGEKVAMESKTDGVCQASDSSGEFRCGFFNEVTDTVIFKATADVENEANQNTIPVMKSAIDGAKDGDTVVVTPVTSLIVQNMADNNWENSLNTATSSVESLISYSTSTTDLVDAGVQGSSLIHQIYNNIPEANRSIVIKTLANMSSVFNGSTISSNVIESLTDDTRIIGKAEGINAQIVKIADTMKLELSETEEAKIKIFNKTLETILVLDGNFSSNCADNYDLIFEANLTVSNDTLLLISLATDIGMSGDVVTVAKNIECILNNAENRNDAIAIVTEWIESRKNLSGDCEELMEDLNLQILKNSCGEGKEVVKFEGEYQCLDIVVCETGFVFDSKTRTCVERRKDAVNSPEDIPAIPNDSAYTIVEDTFPSMPSETAVSMPTDTPVDRASDENYPDYLSETGEDNDTTPFQVD